MGRIKADMKRILAWDISLSSPGAAVVDIDTKRNKAYIVAKSHVRTDGGEVIARRTQHIEAWAQLFARAYGPYDAVVKEGFQGKIAHTSYTIFSAHNAIDRALNVIDLTITEKPIPQSTVKKLAVGKGRAEKSEVEEAVRKWTGYDGEFARDDESDAVAIGIALAVQQGWVTDAGLTEEAAP